MVMAVFSPQYVGQEFVRQYYTMLNKDPLKLHSFYVSHSVFTHGVSSPGKAEKPVTGLEAIRDKICQLNFQNCRANIRSLDSHPTIGGGVVVQVSGELSNADCPMRKFTQTFVLAPQDPDNVKKYFVFNDIFRYQDEVFDETEDETHEETAESYAEEQANYESLLANHRPAPEIAVLEPRPDPEAVNSTEQFAQDEVYTEVVEPQVPAVADEQDSVPLLEGSCADLADASEDAPVSYEEPAVVATVAVQEEEPAPAGPVSWASVLKKNSSQAQGVVVKQSSSAPPKPAQAAPQHSAPVPPPKRREDPAKSPTSKDESAPPARRPPPMALADNCQIFIGNLPSGVHENDVRDVFKEFGKIVEVRLNAKSFGFVAFDNAESAQMVLDLEKGKITISGQEINIEKKRASTGGPRPYGGGGGRRERNDSGSSRKPSGPGTGRGGPRGGTRPGRGGHQEGGGDRPQRGGGRGRDRGQPPR